MMKREGRITQNKDSGAGKIAFRTGTNRRVNREIIGETRSKLEEENKPKRERIFAVPGAVSGDCSAAYKSGGHRFRYPLFALAVKMNGDECGGTSLFNSDILYPIAEGGVNAPRRFLRAGRLAGRGGAVYGKTIVTQKKPLTNQKIAVEAQDTQGEGGGIGLRNPEVIIANLEMCGEVIHAIIYKANSGGKQIGVGVVVQFSHIATPAGVAKIIKIVLVFRKEGLRTAVV